MTAVFLNKTHYEVQTYTLFQGWVNAWSSEDEEGNFIPSIFDTIEEAEAEVEDFMDQMRQALDDGDLEDEEDLPDISELRIVRMTEGIPLFEVVKEYEQGEE